MINITILFNYIIFYFYFYFFNLLFVNYVKYSGLSQTLNLDQEAGEKWIVNLIRDTRVDAKIDFKEVCL